MVSKGWSSKNILLLLATLTFGAVLCEIMLRVALPLDDPLPIARPLRVHKYLPPWNSWRYDPWFHHREPPLSYQNTPGNLVGVSTPTFETSVNTYGFLYPEDKAKRAHPTEVRIALLGGSTFECLALREPKRISAVLERYLQTHLPHKPITVLNLGLSAQDTRSHIATLAHHGVELDLNYVVLLFGANDLYRMGAGFSTAGIGERIFQVDVSTPGKQWLLTRSQLGRRLYRMTERWRKPEALLPRAADSYIAPYVAFRNGLPSLPIAPEASSDLVDEYARNILTLHGIAHAHSVKALFLTQPSIWSQVDAPTEHAVLWMATYKHKNTWYKLSPATAHAMLAQLNERLLAQCQAQSLWCIDLTNQVPASLEFFYDDMHFNEKGAELVALKIGAAIQEIERK